MSQLSIQVIPIGLLLEHPENSNRMNPTTSKKLRRHIERSGRYEPLTVRPHPDNKGKFQVINGHNRLHVLKALKYKAANCLVWNINDDQTRLYLATLNRLSGTDIPEHRAVLIEHLFGAFDNEELSLLLPENEKQIEDLRHLTSLKLDQLVKQDTIEEKLKVPVILTFMLEETEAKEINLALDLIITNEKEKRSRSQALACLARFYLMQSKPTADIK
ncbi:MAG: hypothetical protein ACYDG5_04360 [Dehalococcoidales bacterium]